MKKIILTNWINLIGIILSLCICNFYFFWGEKNIFGQSLFATFYVFTVFGSVFWIGVLICLITIDIIFIFIKLYKNNLNLGIIMQTFLISLPFIYWSIIYDNVRWLFIVEVITFLITQYIRKGIIKKIINSK